MRPDNSTCPVCQCRFYARSDRLKDGNIPCCSQDCDNKRRREASRYRPHPCQCGCGKLTKRTWATGHQPNHGPAPLAPEYFWTRVNKTSTCWLWTGATNKLGYGILHMRRLPGHAHQAAYVLAKGPIPDGLCVLHKCDNPPCCNPEHLFLGTRTDNNRDMVQKNRQRGPIGLDNAATKITEDDVREIRRRAASGESQRRITCDYPINSRSVSNIINRLTWSHIP